MATMVASFAFLSAASVEWLLYLAIWLAPVALAVLVALCIMLYLVMIAPCNAHDKSFPNT